MSFKYVKLFIVSLCILTMVACSDPTETELTLTYQLEYDGKPLASFAEVDYPLGYKMFFTKYSMFISDITISTGDTEVLLDEVDFIDLLTNIDETSAAAGISRVYTNVPTDSYTSIKFNIGVPTSVNATNPSQYSAENPLANTGEYWEGWSSYIFHKIEGKIDVDADNTFETGVALHIGSDQAFRSINIAMPITLSKEQETVIIKLDLKDVLNLSTGYYDFIATPQVHHLGVLPKVLPILDNTAAKFKITEL